MQQPSILSFSHFTFALVEARLAVCHLIYEYQWIVIAIFIFLESRRIWGKIHIHAGLINQEHLVEADEDDDGNDDNFIINKAYGY